MSREERKLQYYLKLFAQKEEKNKPKPKSVKSSNNTIQGKSKRGRKRKTRQVEKVEENQIQADVKIELDLDESSDCHYCTNVQESGRQFKSSLFKINHLNLAFEQPSKGHHLKQDLIDGYADRRMSETEHSTVTE